MHRSSKPTRFFSAAKSHMKNNIIIPLIGFFSLIWFLLRVIPKPSRAMYPCQRVAFPIASGFVLWLMGLFSSIVFFKKLKNYLQNIIIIIFKSTILRKYFGPSVRAYQLNIDGL